MGCDNLLKWGLNNSELDESLAGITKFNRLANIELGDVVIALLSLSKSM